MCCPVKSYAVLERTGQKVLRIWDWRWNPSAAAAYGAIGLGLQIGRGTKIVPATGAKNAEFVFPLN